MFSVNVILPVEVVLNLITVTEIIRGLCWVALLKKWKKLYISYQWYAIKHRGTKWLLQGSQVIQLTISTCFFFIDLWANIHQFRQELYWRLHAQNQPEEQHSSIVGFTSIDFIADASNWIVVLRRNISFCFIKKWIKNNFLRNILRLLDINLIAHNI